MIVQLNQAQKHIFQIQPRRRQDMRFGGSILSWGNFLAADLSSIGNTKGDACHGTGNDGKR